MNVKYPNFLKFFKVLTYITDSKDDDDEIIVNVLMIYTNELARIYKQILSLLTKVRKLWFGYLRNKNTKILTSQIIRTCCKQQWGPVWRTTIIKLVISQSIMYYNCSRHRRLWNTITFYHPYIYRASSTAMYINVVLRHLSLFPTNFPLYKSHLIFLSYITCLHVLICHFISPRN